MWRMQHAIIPEEADDHEDILIYYFSNFKIFANNLIQELKMCTIFCNQLITSLGEQWLLLAQQTAYIIQNNQKIYTTSRFILDTFLYAWFIYPYNEKEFPNLIKQKLSNFQYEGEDLEALQDAYVACALELTQIYQQYEIWKINFPKIITPLLVLNEYQKKPRGNQQNQEEEDEQEIAKLIEHIRLDQDASKSCQTIPIMNHFYSSRTISDQAYQKHKNQRILQQRLIEKLNSKKRIAENLSGIAEGAEKQNWQTVKQMVVMIWEIDHIDDEGKNSKIRFIQPAVQFYSMCLKLWIIEKSSSDSGVIIQF